MLRLSAPQVLALLTEAGLMAPQVYQALRDAKIQRSAESITCLLMVGVEGLRSVGVTRESVIRLVGVIYDGTESVPIDGDAS